MANPIETPIVLDVETRAETYDGKALDQNYFVSEADLENYVRYRRSATKQPNLTVKEVKSYGFDSSQTLFYILNYEKGWEVVSADKRVQPTLAYGDEGAFTMDCDNEPMKFWMNILANGVLQTRQRTGDSAVATASTASKEESDKADDEEQNVAFWNAISPTQQQNSRGGGIQIPTWGPLFPPSDSLGGEIVMRRYFIPNAVVVENDISTSGNVLPTRWGQYYPWNNYCPYITGSTSSKVPAGCTAVAGAQLLYYLYTAKGWEIQAPSYASCNGQIPNYVQTFSGFSTTPWGFMALSEKDTNTARRQYSARLIAYLGFLSNMDYDNDGSGASLEDLKAGLEEGYGISSTVSSFSTSMVCTALNSYPVVVSGYRDLFRKHGHTWLIDEYRVFFTTRRRYYIETIQQLTDAELQLLTIDDATGYTEEHSTSSQFHMNWGWDGTSDGYFGLLPEDWDGYEEGDPYEYGIDFIHNLNL